MIRIEPKKTNDHDRCTACFENEAAFRISLGRENPQEPGNFAGGYVTLGLCGNCAKEISDRLAMSGKEAIL
jgi:hypothetical protein